MSYIDRLLNYNLTKPKKVKFNLNFYLRKYFYPSNMDRTWKSKNTFFSLDHISKGVFTINHDKEKHLDRRITVIVSHCCTLGSPA